MAKGAGQYTSKEQAEIARQPPHIKSTASERPYCVLKQAVSCRSGPCQTLHVMPVGPSLTYSRRSGSYERDPAPRSCRISARRLFPPLSRELLFGVWSPNTTCASSLGARVVGGANLPSSDLTLRTQA